MLGRRDCYAPALMSSQPTPIWERRYRAPKLLFPAWSPDAPDKLAYASSESGSYQLYAWDRTDGTRRRVTDDPVGVTDGVPTRDGSGVVWFHDETGDESGQWRQRAWGGGEVRPLLEGVPWGWQAGLAVGRTLVAAAINDRDGYGLYVSDGAGAARRIHHHAEAVGIGGSEEGGWNRGGLSADDAMLCIEHAEHGDLIHQSLRVLDPVSGSRVGELGDEGKALLAAAWSPLVGDQRLAIVHELEGQERPAIWDLSSGERRDIAVDLPGPVTVRDWWPDASALLILHVFEGVDQLLRLDLTSGELVPVSHEPGYISGARVRPDGRVWMRLSTSSHEARVVSETGEELIAPEGERSPGGRAFASWRFPNPAGQSVHGFYVTPPGGGPFPTIMHVHGGPSWLNMDVFDPEVQALVDHGFAVGMVNYRGSIGYGARWRDSLIGNIGFPETEDVIAGLDDLVARGIADPSRAVIAGWSWGGYITLLALGLHPERWICGVAGVPVGDYFASYEDCSPLLQAYDRALLGGSVHEVPDLVRERSPITYVDRVAAPVFILAGENDTRCPIRQVRLYVDALRAQAGDVELYEYGTGHSSFVIDEEVRQMRLILEYLAKRVPGASAPE